MSVEDTFNFHMVCVQGDKIVILNPPRTPIEKDRALVLAAWIVVLADPLGDSFNEILETIKNT